LQDEELIRIILHGNGELYAEIVERYQSKLYRTAYHYTQNIEDARDLTQEIFIKAYNSLAGFKRGSSFSTWLYRIAVNHCIDWSRKKKPRQHEVDTVVDLYHKEGSPEDHFLRLESAAEIQGAVRSLPEIYSTVLLLYYFEDFTPREIADILDTSKRTVETRLFRGRKLLRESLQSRWDGGEGNDLPTQQGRVAQLR